MKTSLFNARDQHRVLLCFVIFLGFSTDSSRGKHVIWGNIIVDICMLQLKEHQYEHYTSLYRIVAAREGPS